MHYARTVAFTMTRRSCFSERIFEMKYTPPLSDKKVTAAIVILFAFSLVCFVIPGTVGSFGAIPPAIFQLAGVISGVAGIFLAVRYRFTRFTYSVTLRERGADEDAIEAWEDETDVTRIPPSLLDFTVVKSQGKRPGTVECVLSLDDLKKVVRITGKNKLSKTAKEEFGCSVLYDYTANIAPTMVTVLIFTENGKNIAVAIECDEQMTGALSSVATSDKYGKGS